jgi:ubiquinone/menaquinone biosynthesis C-methylase UbiE
MMLPAAHARPYRGLPMEGMLARWYAKNTSGSLAEFRSLAKRIAAGLPHGAAVLEIAPGPGFLAIELARLGCRVTGIDISRTFVQLAQDEARRAGVEVDFRVGDAAHLPLADSRANAGFDFIVCRAAFKNFGDPVGALAEMHRVLRPGGRALILDMRRDATKEAISDEVSRMNLDLVGRLMTTTILRRLRKRAYSRQDFDAMAAATPFGVADIVEGPIGFEVWLTK